MTIQDPEQHSAQGAAHDSPPSLSFPVIGIGASAGGLEACSELLPHLPADPGMAFLLVLHLQPDRASHLTEILRHKTALPVLEAEDGMRVEPNRLYVIPPNKTMQLVDGTLALTARPPHGVHMPIDHLFRSLARTQKSQAVGIILSGGGTDGTLGCQEIKAEGGVTFAQDEKSARHDAMPRSAVADSCIDYVLPPPQIARELVRVTQHACARPGPLVQTPPDEDAVNQILLLLRGSCDVDFTHYKRTTVCRRIQRRMALRGVEQMQDYLRLARAEPAELHHLYQDFLIRVTQFFRDPDAFEALKAGVFPALVQGRAAGAPLRVWVAGCSTGEEVYSLAIALLEYLGGRHDNFAVKVLATDLNEAALEKARAGLYVDNIEMDVGPERLRRYFARVDGHYQISKAVRDLCVFSRHNLASDPPFSHLDLVSCRNVLIYMDSPLQKRVLPTLHYALNPEGFLFLGASESPGPFSDLFVPADPKHRIFRKKPLSAGAPLDFGPYAGLPAPGRHAAREEGAPLWNALEVQREADRIVLARYAPVGVVVDEALTVIQFRGRTAPYLEPAPGMANLDLLRMLREGLLADVRAALAEARAENAAAVRDRVLVNDGAAPRRVRVEVIPFKVPPAGARFFLVLFQDLSDEAPAAAAPPPAAAPSAGQQVAQLQQELAALRDYLQSVIEDQENTNEELTSANEEILSANEELQSTNEELQTAKEEAQSANEELATVNDELRHRNAELARVNNDLLNLLTGVNIPIVMVGRDLRLRRFTPLAEKLFNLIPTDLGRPIGDIKSNLQLADLTPLIAGVIDTLTPYEGDVQDKDGRWYALRIRPYVTLDNKIDGASVVLLDIDALKRGT